MRPYDSLFEQTADAMCELRRDGFVLRANRACRALLNPRACTFADSFDARHAAAIIDSTALRGSRTARPKLRRAFAWNLCSIKPPA